jgi:hypothetical protein
MCLYVDVSRGIMIVLKVTVRVQDQPLVRLGWCRPGRIGQPMPAQLLVDMLRPLLVILKVTGDAPKVCSPSASRLKQIPLPWDLQRLRRPRDRAGRLCPELLKRAVVHRPGEPRFGPRNWSGKRSFQPCLFQRCLKTFLKTLVFLKRFENL